MMPSNGISLSTVETKSLQRLLVRWRLFLLNVYCKKRVARTFRFT